MLFFTSCYNCKMALLYYFKRIDKPKVTLPSKLDSLSECQLQQMNNHIQKTVGDKAIQVESARSGINSTTTTQLKNSGYGQICLRKWCDESLYAFHQNARKTCIKIHSEKSKGNMHALKLTPSYNFKCI